MNKYPGITKITGETGTTYQVRYRTLNGTQRARTFKRLEEAKAFKANTDNARRSGGVIPGTADKILFADLTKDWLANKQHRPSTAKRRDLILGKHILPAIGHLPISKIRHSMLQDLVNSWSAAGLSANSIRQHVNWMRPIFDRAVKDDLIARNPASGLDLPKVENKEPRALTPAECGSLLAATDPHYAPVIEVLLATGFRWSELANLNIADFDRHARTLRVDSSKTSAGMRTIRIDEVDSTRVVKYLMSTGRAAAAPDSPLFTSPQGERLDYHNFARRVFKPACQRAGLEGITLHSLRRTHATMLITSGANAKAVQHRMGHASIQTTLKHYATSTDDDRTAAASAKAEYLK